MAIKRRFRDIRHLILKNLYSKRKTVNQIAVGTKINWKTVDNHLIYLLGRSLVKIVFSSPYVKIFQLTDVGKDFLEFEEYKKNGKILENEVLVK